MVKGGADSAAESVVNDEAQSETTTLLESTYDPQQQHAQQLSLAGTVIATAGAESVPAANTTYQHYLFPSVSLGGQLQNIAIPAQVALSVQQGSLHTSNVSQGIAVTSSSTYTISSPQSLARILAAGQGYSVVASGRPVANLTTTHQQIVNNGQSAVLNVSSAARNPQQQRTAFTVRPEGVAVRLTAVPTTPMTHQAQTLLLDNVGTLHLQPSDLTKIHSYSLSKSPPVTDSTVSVTNLVASTQKLSTPGSHIPHRVLTPKQSGKPTSSVNSSATNFILQGVAQNVPSGVSFSTPVVIASGAASPVGARPAKRIKLEEKPPASEEVAIMRRKICEYRIQQVKTNKENYVEHLTELFFLQNGGNMMDYLVWKRRLSPQLLNFLKANALDGDDEEEQRLMQVSSIAAAAAITASVPSVKTTQQTSSLPVQSKPPQTPASSHSGKQTFVPEAKTTVPKISSIASITNNRLATRQHSLSTVYDSSIGSQEEIVERAKQEAFVIQRISELRREGLWSSKRLPKVQEPPRAKAHWDYLLEEMVWLATDFAQESKWKKAAAKKCAKMVMKYHQEREQKAEKAEKEEQQKLRRIASQVAREIKQFWSSIEKLVEYKQQTRLDEKRKRALDLHLNFIVDQTEKYSSWLTQGMSQNIKMEAESSDDDDFKPSKSESDDEETIDKEEAIDTDEVEQKQEIKLLQEESELPIEDILEQIPSEILERPASPFLSEATDQSDIDTSSVKQENEDMEYDVSSEEEDDEATIEVEEREPQNYDQELKELQEEGDLPIEQLYEKYAQAYEGELELPASDISSESKESEDEDVDVEGDSSEDSLEEEQLSDEEESEEDVGMEFLVDAPKDDDEESSTKDQAEEPSDSKVPSKEITDIAADALSFQPKGNTLSTTQVCTKVPFLLKHSLREYQHIGLDWLVAMNRKKLNGILADEMGLGKTIQTIALLAHLACEKGNWGPHLIVVPTSVMLNWEIEIKKWCPAFKILTYYGSPKERRLKRQGWTKPNTFHVCITSYKLVVQDHQSFRRKRWKYFILDEAQHIKNFKSQRWQMLLNFQSSCRLLLTGTPLQNSLMELWSLMHFLMPNVFQSHREFREWFVNPVSGMIEGNHEYNDGLIKRLHKILRPFLLRRQKCEVEKQLPKKYEHVIFCRLSTRQRYLYDDFMSQAKTRETLAGGNLMSVINVLMQLRKVCNHPNMFEPRPTVSPYLMDAIIYNAPSLVVSALNYNPFKHVSLAALNLLLADLELCLTAFAAHRIKKFQTPSHLIQRIDSQPNPPPRCPSGKIRLHIRTSSSSTPNSSPAPVRTALVPPARPSSAVVQPTQQKIVVVQGSGSASSSRASSPVASTGGLSMAQLTALSTPVSVSTPITVQLHQTGQGGARVSLPFGGFGRLVQTSSGQHLLVTSQASTSINSASPASVTTAAVIPQASKVTLPQPSNITTATTFTKLQPATQSPMWNTTKPVVRVAPMHVVTQSATQTVVNQSNKVHVPVKPAVEAEPHKPVVSEPSRSLFYLDSLSKLKLDHRSEKLSLLGRANIRRCAACPIYGRDLIEAVTVPSRFSSEHSLFVMENLMKTPEMLVKELSSVISKFVFAIPAVSAPCIKLRVFHPSPSDVEVERRLEQLQQELSANCSFLHQIVNNMCTQFPDLRLIQYDCGKLQTLDKLLWKLKTDHHRVLIFTQMTRMLDILEQFLNYHGHTYLRLDGATRVDQRQALMERFNADSRIFCFILSTRSGGVGVNLTGADTVIFYDSDWNPTMDAQAQDRCHRIGQTRDVHIYRLISEKTVEENILKKANQKRLLGDLAIEGGNFTTAFFQKNTIRDLFGVPVTEEKTEVKAKVKTTESLSQLQLEHALGMAEEELDAQAAKTAKAEAAAEFAEFDESIPLDTDSREIEEKSQAEEELDRLMEQLTPVEKYAMQFLESIQEPFSLEQLKQAEEEIEAQKKDWELGRLKALKEEEERRTAQMEDEEESSLTYAREEATNQVFISVIGREQMPTWAPPTPPQDENDLYIDYSGNFLYEQTIMPESQLPPVYIKKDAKRLKIDPIPISSRKQKTKKEEVVHIPRSLFDRPTAAILRMRREAKLQKVKSLSLGSMVFPRAAGVKQTTMMMNRPAVDGQTDSVEWFIHEDWTILQVIQNLQDLPLGLTVLSPAHIPNWDLVTDVVNALCRVHRSPKQCKTRYENVIVPREEGKIFYDANPKKQKKVKNIYKTKNRPMRTSQLFIQDNNTSFTYQYNTRFEAIKAIANKRTPTLKPWFVAPAGKNPKHTAVLQENGINYDQPPNPVQLAAVRAERIAREKQKNQAAAVNQAQQQQQVAAAPANLAQQQAVIAAGMQQLQAIQQGVQLTKAGIQTGVTTVSLSKPLGSGIVAVGTSSGTFAISKALTQTSGATPTTIPTATVATLGSPATLRAQRPAVTAAMTVQDMVAAVSSGQVRTLVTTTTAGGTAPAVVSVAGLTAAQLQAATQRISSTGLTANSVSAAVNQLVNQSTANRNLTASQVQAFRQTALLRQQRMQEQQLKLFQVATTQQQATGAKVTVSVSSPSTTGQQKLQQQQQTAAKQQQRQMTEAEVLQIVRKQQQKQAAMTTAQILAQAQLQQQSQQNLSANLQAPMVKTVSTPSSLGTSSVTIPVSAVTMAGVNINVTLPQAKGVGVAQGKGATTSATVTQQQLRQFQIQQQLLQQQQRKVQLQQQQQQQKQMQSKAATQLGAVQIVQGTAAQQGGKTTLSAATGMTVQQIHQVLKQVTAQSLPHAVLQVTTASVTSTSGTSPATVQARVIPVPQAVTGLGQPQAAMKQTIQVVTASPSLTANVQAQPTFRAVTESGLVAGTLKTTTTPAAATATILKTSPTVMVSGQSPTILQPMGQQQAVTLALRAGTQHHGQPQVQIQVQPATTTSSQIPVTIHTAATSVIPAISSIVSENAQSSAATTQFVQAAIQAAKQQQQQQQQQQRASPYTMRLRNPPKQ